jgi:alpha-1,3-glucan synthase
LNNTIDRNCKLPEIFDDHGGPLNISLPRGCFDSDFDQFGDIEAFGSHANWKRQFSKFSGVQDRLREWSDKVAPKLVALSCLVISSLDIDGFRIDKATQITLNFVAMEWAPEIRQCARDLGKNNFFVPGEITARLDFGGLYIGRGLKQKLDSVEQTVNVPSASFMRASYALDSTAFHYSIYRSLVSFLGIYGNIDSDLPIDLVDAWNEMLLSIDYINAETQTLDPRYVLISFDSKRNVWDWKSGYFSLAIFDNGH